MNQKSLLEIKKFRGLAVFFTNRKKVDNFAKIIESLPDNSAIVIREYDLDKESREQFALEISALARKRGIKILVGKDFSLARKIKADGIHFSDFDKIPLQFFKKNSFPKKFIFSFAAHEIKSILRIKKAKPNMIFISPVFPSSSHAETKNIGIKTLAKIAFKYKNLQYLYALGGINAINLSSVRKLNILGFGAIDFFKPYKSL